MHNLPKLTLRERVVRLALLLILLLVLLTGIIVRIFQRQPPRVALDLVSAMSSGLIQVDVTADGYRSAYVEITNTGDSGLEVIIPQGLKLANSNTDHQDLAVGTEKTAQVAPSETVSTTVSTYCISPHRGAPSLDDEFSVAGVVSDDILKILGSGQPSHLVQEAVWRQVDSRNIPADFTRTFRGELNRVFGRFLDLLLVVVLMLGAVTIGSLVRLSYFGTDREAFEETWWIRWLRRLKATVVQMQQQINKIWARRRR